MKDEADNLTKDWVGHKIELVRFEDGQADFEIRDLTARCYVSDWALNEFINGEFILNPSVWIDKNNSQIVKPFWFNGRELFNLNNVFERDFKKFRK